MPRAHRPPPPDQASTDDPERGRRTAEYWRVYVTLTSPAYRYLSDQERAKRAKVSPARFSRIKRDPEMVAAVRVHISAGMTAELPKLSEAIQINALLPGKEGAKDRELWGRIADLFPRAHAPAPGTLAVDLGPALAAALARAHDAPLAIPAAPAAPAAPSMIDVTPPAEAERPAAVDRVRDPFGW